MLVQNQTTGVQQTSGRPPETPKKSPFKCKSMPNGHDVADILHKQVGVAEGDTWSAHTTREGRIYYCNHVTRSASWLPPIEQWPRIQENELDQLPYGWEQALDTLNKPYYLNHLNKTTTYEVPVTENWFHDPQPTPEPRTVTLNRNATMGFGFVAGSERPVIVRYVTEDGPSVGKLLPSDEIFSVNGVDVRDVPREKVISMVRACEKTVTLTVCQPKVEVNSCGRKSTLKSTNRKMLKMKPNKVRFAESVCVNGAPIFPPSAFSLGEMCAPPMANVLKVFLENGQTKSFKYDASTKVQDVIDSLKAKLCIGAIEHFSLCVEHIKSLRRNKLTLLDPQDTLARIASKPGAHKLRCLFRVTFVPINASHLAQRDPSALDYLFSQCCNDVTAERFAPELQPDAALRLAALHMHQHALANNMAPNKLTVKDVEREFGLERFLPPSLLESMKRKEIRRLVSHFLRSYSSLGSSIQNQGKALTPLQAKLLYLDLVSQLPSYGAKCFSAGPPRIATPTDFLERILLVSPRFGLSQISGNQNTVPVPIARLEDIRGIEVFRQESSSDVCMVEVILSSDRSLHLYLDDHDAPELALVLQGYHRVITGKSIPVELEREPPPEDMAPPYLAQHNVKPEKWSYVEYRRLPLQRAIFIAPPEYHPKYQEGQGLNITNGFNTIIKRANVIRDYIKPLSGSSNNNNNYVDNNMNLNRDNATSKPANDLRRVVEEEAIRRVREMNELVEESVQYLQKNHIKDDTHNTSNNNNTMWTETNLDDANERKNGTNGTNQDDPHSSIESDSDSQKSEINQQLKHSDSLLLLAHNQMLENPMLDLTAALELLQSDLESDNDSTNTPPKSLSPVKAPLRASFGLHSPVIQHDLREYLKQMNEDEEAQGLDIDVLLDLDPDIIDLTLLPPPQTPDELDDLSKVPAGPPVAFADVDKERAMLRQSVYSNVDTGDLEEFLRTVTVRAPQNKHQTEITPEEIMKYIIPPPPAINTSSSNISTSPSSSTSSRDDRAVLKSSGYSSSDSSASTKQVIEYSTIERKGSFSCCGKGKVKTPVENQEPLPPKGNGITPPRPPKYGDDTDKSDVVTNKTSGEENGVVKTQIKAFQPPKKPPLPPVPKVKSPVPTLKSSLKSHPRHACIGSPHLQRNMSQYRNIESGDLDDRRCLSTPTSPYVARKTPVAPVGPLNGLNGASNGATNGLETAVDNKLQLECHRRTISGPSRVNGIHETNTLGYRKHQTYGPSTLPRRNFALMDPSIPLMASTGIQCDSLDLTEVKTNRSFLHDNHKIEAKNPHVKVHTNGVGQQNGDEERTKFRENLLCKSEVALAGLLVRLDQVAAQCSQAQAHGGGKQICEQRFQVAQDELTQQSLQLVTCSKAVVVALSNMNSTNLPEHLGSCLTILRRLTELSQDITTHTLSPLQTRNLVLKVHNVTSSFRELLNATIIHLTSSHLEEQLAHHAECLANVLAALLRTLRVFSP